MSENFEVDGEQVENTPEGDPPNGIEKAGPACGICCLGWLVFPLALFILGSNERNFVCKNKDILNAESNTVTAACTNPPDNTFVFFSCPLDTAAFKTFNLASFNTGFTKPDSVKFTSLAASQKVEMHQCEQTCTQTTSGTGKDKKTKTNCQYEMKWSENPLSIINSLCHSGNKCTTDKLSTQCPAGPGYSAGMTSNPTFPTNLKNGVVIRADTVKAGDFNVNLYKDRFGADTAVSLVKAEEMEMVRNGGGDGNGTEGDGEQVRFLGDVKSPSDENPTHMNSLVSTASIPTPTDSNTFIEGNFMVTCKSGSDNKVGCIRVSWMMNTDKDVSIIANSGNKGKIVAEATKASWGCSAGSYQTMYKQKMTKEQLITSENSGNESSLYLLRVVGILGAWLGIYCCFYPIVAMADILQDYAEMVPCIGPCLGFFGEIMEWLVQIVVCCMSCSMGCSAALFVVAIVWLVMRPLMGAALMVVCLCLCGGVAGVAVMAPKKNAEGGGGDPEEGS